MAAGRRQDLATRPSVYLDLENEDERVKLSNPAE
jgi:hypothetical protein